jgi:hypothetical protein
MEERKRLNSIFDVEKSVYKEKIEYLENELSLLNEVMQNWI